MLNAVLILLLVELLVVCESGVWGGGACRDAREGLPQRGVLGRVGDEQAVPHGLGGEGRVIVPAGGMSVGRWMCSGVSGAHSKGRGGP